MQESLSKRRIDFDLPSLNILPVDKGISFYEFISILKRHARSILMCFAVAMLTMTLFILIIPAKYNSQVQLLVASEAPVISGLQAYNFLTKGGDAHLYNQAEIIRSDQMSRQVAEMLELHKEVKLSANIQNNQDLAVILAAKKLQNSVSVRVVPGSQIITIDVSDTDKERAALVANKIAAVYLNQRLDQKQQEIEKLNNWLDSRYQEVQQQLSLKAQELSDYNKNHDYVTEADLELINQQIISLNQKLTEKRIAFSQTYARLQDLKGYNAGNATRDVLASQIMQNLKEAELKIQDELKILTQRYGHKHPFIIDVKERLKGIQDQISSEIKSIGSSLSNELDELEQVIDEIETELQSLNDQKNEVMTLYETQTILKQDIETKSALFQELLKETVLAHQDDIEPVINARIISKAIPALKPSFPIPSLFYGLAGLVGIFVGIGLALLSEMTNRAIRSATELEECTGLPCYGLSPFIKNLKPEEASRYILSSKAVKEAELIRSVRATLDLRAKKDTPNIIAVTSSVSGEGKTTFSTWLSVLSARVGEKVIVIDCDFRRATLHKAFNKVNKSTLVDYLSNDVNLEDVIYRQDPSGVHAIFGKNVPGQALELINSKRMRTLIESLGKAYDLVILDCPTALAVSDSLFLAKQADMTLYNVAWNKTDRETVAAGLKQFQGAGIDNLAVVLGKVDRQEYQHFAHDLQYYMHEA